MSANDPTMDGEMLTLIVPGGAATEGEARDTVRQAAFTKMQQMVAAYIMGHAWGTTHPWMLRLAQNITELEQDGDLLYATQVALIAQRDPKRASILVPTFGRTPRSIR